MSKHLLSQLAHVELLSPRPAETVAFLEHQLGLEISERAWQSVYLRGWGEFFHHSLKVTESALLHQASTEFQKSRMYMLQAGDLTVYFGGDTSVSRAKTSMIPPNVQSTQ